MLAENSNRPNIVRGLAVRGSDSPEPDSVVALMNFVLPVRILVPPPAEFGGVVPPGHQGPKSRGFCRCFGSGEFRGRLQLLSIGAGEYIFLRNLRTSSGSPIPNLREEKAGSGRFVSNPSPSTDGNEVFLFEPTDSEFAGSIGPCMWPLRGALRH